MSPEEFNKKYQQLLVTLNAKLQSQGHRVQVSSRRVNKPANYKYFQIIDIVFGGHRIQSFSIWSPHSGYDLFWDEEITF